MVFFNPYDISPYAAGVVKIEFPYEDLKGILKPEYFPAAADPAAKAAAPVLSFPANMNPEQYQTVEYVEAATNDSNVTFAMYGAIRFTISPCPWLIGWRNSRFCGNQFMRQIICQTQIWWSFKRMQQWNGEIYACSTILEMVSRKVCILAWLMKMEPTIGLRNNGKRRSCKMRKWIAAALCLSMILSVCGCQQQEEGEPSVSSTAAPTTPTEGTEASVTQVPEKVTDPTQDPTEVAVPSEAPSEGETTPPVTGTQEIPLVAVSLIPVLEEETDENGTTIFRYQYQTITAILPDAPDASEKITSTMEERGKEAAGSVEEILNWARQDYTGDSSWVPYSCQVAFVPARVDATTVSFSGAVWSFSGGVHPNCTRISCSFDAASGDVLTLSDILSNTDVVEALYLKVMDGLDQRSRELDPNQSVWNDGYEEIVREHFNLEHVSSASWYFSDTGMHFYFFTL